MRKFLLYGWVLLALGASFAVQARDISVEQKAASQAQDAYAKARADYDSVSKQVEAQEKFVAEQQARLETLKEQQATALATREKAKVNMEAKEKILNEVWDQRNK